MVRASFSMAFAAVICASPVAHAQNEIPGWGKAMNNLAHEYAQCAAYFLVVSVALENSNEPETAKRYSEVSDTALNYASMYGQEAGLLAQTTQSRFELEFVEMSKRIGGNTSNIAILGNDYASACQSAMEDTDSRLRYWVSKETGAQ